MGDHRLLQLALQGLVGAEIEGLGQLLCQGGAALDGVARPPVDPGGAGYALGVNGAVVVKAPVLRREERLGHIGRQVGQSDRKAVLGPSRGDYLAGAVLEGHARGLVGDQQFARGGDFRRLGQEGPHRKIGRQTRANNNEGDRAKDHGPNPGRAAAASRTS